MLCFAELGSHQIYVDLTITVASMDRIILDDTGEKDQLVVNRRWF